MALPRNVTRCVIRGLGFDSASSAQVWKDQPRETLYDDRGRPHPGRPEGKPAWHFDGPTSVGPRHARMRARGPYWRGEVSAAFVGTLVSRAKKAGYRVECTTAKGASVLAGARRRR